jgi:predicted metal-binding membrane protein
MTSTTRTAAGAPDRGPLLLASLIGLAWLVSIGSQLTGTAGLLHHHTLIEDGPPLWVAIPFFLLGWQVMLAGMMLPASVPVMDTIAARIGTTPRTTIGLLAGFAAVWTVFGLGAFMGDFVLHHIVDATPWLAARPWLIEGGVLALAGAYQLSPFKRRSLEACRHPAHLVAGTATASATSLRLGARHGLDCIGASWALMLLMFAEGFANLAWMATLTVVMVIEATGRQGQRLGIVVGAALLTLSIASMAGGFVSG